MDKESTASGYEVSRELEFWLEMYRLNRKEVSAINKVLDNINYSLTLTTKRWTEELARLSNQLESEALYKAASEVERWV